MDWKKLIKLLYPPVWVIALLVPACAAALVLIFLNNTNILISLLASVIYFFLF